VSDAVFHRTRTYCCDCQELHPAALRVDRGAVLLDVDCPRAPRSVCVSSDAATFRAIRAKSTLGAPPLDSVRGFTWINFLEITHDCDCACAVCYADAGPGRGDYLSVDEVTRVARELKAQGLQAISLTGGEPTLHPRLLEIVSAVRRVGLDATLISNGLRLGRDPTLARRLRRSGLTYLYLALDTLRPEVCRRLRGDELVAVRQRALSHAAQSGLRFGLDVTVVRDNLDEVGALLRYASPLAPRLGLVTYLSAAKTGRFLLGDDVCVTREDVIGRLVSAGVVEGLTTDHFWPFPRFAPLGLDLHPDCGALLLLAVDEGALRPLDDYVDVAALYRRLAAARGAIDRRRAAALLSWSFLRAVRPRRAAAVARMVAGLLSGRGRSSILSVVVEQFLDPRHQDEERLARCTTCRVLRNGHRVPLCVFQHGDPRRAPLTRATGAHGL
jgi:7,8-dihydro-6-hydroxymethylpterin dimethyltransferase